MVVVCFFVQKMIDKILYVAISVVFLMRWIHSKAFLFVHQRSHIQTNTYVRDFERMIDFCIPKNIVSNQSPVPEKLLIPWIGISRPRTWMLRYDAVINLKLVESRFSSTCKLTNLNYIYLNDQVSNKFNLMAESVIETIPQDTLTCNNPLFNQNAHSAQILTNLPKNQ